MYKNHGHIYNNVRKTHGYMYNSVIKIPGVIIPHSLPRLTKQPFHSGVAIADARSNYINMETLHYTIKRKVQTSISMVNIYTELYIPLWCGKTTHVTSR